MINVHVIVGIGSWTAETHITLAACPHVGDQIAWGRYTAECRRVTIWPDHVQVEDLIRFQSEDEAKQYFKE